MAYNTIREPYIRTLPPQDEESRLEYINEELRKLETTLDRINSLLTEIDNRLVGGGL